MNTGKFFCFNILDGCHVSHLEILQNYLLGPITQSVASPTADLGITSSILAQSHNFMEIVREIISMVILLLPLIQEKLLSVTSESMCTEYWLTT